MRPYAHIAAVTRCATTRTLPGTLSARGGHTADPRPQPRPGAGPGHRSRRDGRLPLDGPGRQERRRRGGGRRDAHRAAPPSRWTASSSSARARRTKHRCSTTASASATARRPLTDIAVDPIDGTTLTAQGRGNALAVIACERAGHDVQPRPVRLHGEDRGRARGCGRRSTPRRRRRRTSSAVAKAKGESIRDITAVILDRDRHAGPDRGSARGRRARPPDPRR